MFQQCHLQYSAIRLGKLKKQPNEPSQNARDPMDTEDAAGVMAFENYLHKGLSGRRQQRLANLHKFIILSIHYK